jgi:hypothetical protein
MSGGLIGPMQTGETWVLQPRLLRVREQNHFRSGIVRMQERFAGVNGDGVKSLLQNFSPPNDSLPFVKCFFEAYPLAAEQLLAAEGGRSLLFSNFATTRAEASPLHSCSWCHQVWFKKVSSDMWISHVSTDVNVVRILCGLQMSLSRVSPRECILQGSCEMVDGEGRACQGPFGNINQALIQRLLERKYGLLSLRWPVVQHPKLTGR